MKICFYFYRNVFVSSSSYIYNYRSTSNKSWGEGLTYSKKKAELFASGSTQKWYSFKNALCEHMSCSSTRSGGQFHMKALQHRIKEERKNAKNMAVNVNVVGAGLEVCKMKASACQFESMIAFLAFCNTEVGNIGHGR